MTAMTAQNPRGCVGCGRRSIARDRVCWRCREGTFSKYDSAATNERRAEYLARVRPLDTRLAAVAEVVAELASLTAEHGWVGRHLFCGALGFGARRWSRALTYLLAYNVPHEKRTRDGRTEVAVHLPPTEVDRVVRLVRLEKWRARR